MLMSPPAATNNYAQRKMCQITASKNRNVSRIRGRNNEDSGTTTDNGNSCPTQVKRSYVNHINASDVIKLKSCKGVSVRLQRHSRSPSQIDEPDSAGRTGTTDAKNGTGNGSSARTNRAVSDEPVEISSDEEEVWDSNVLRSVVLPPTSPHRNPDPTAIRSHGSLFEFATVQFVPKTQQKNRSPPLLKPIAKLLNATKIQSFPVHRRATRYRHYKNSHFKEFHKLQNLCDSKSSTKRQTSMKKLRINLKTPPLTRSRLNANHGLKHLLPPLQEHRLRCLRRQLVSKDQ